MCFSLGAQQPQRRGSGSGLSIRAAFRLCISRPAHQRVRARAPGGDCWHFPVHNCPRLCSPPSPRQLRHGPLPLLGPCRAELGTEARERGWQGRGAGGRGYGFPWPPRLPFLRFTSQPELCFPDMLVATEPHACMGVCACARGGGVGAESGGPPAKDTPGSLSSGCTWRESWGPPAGLHFRSSHYRLPAPPRQHLHTGHSSEFLQPSLLLATGRTRAGSQQAPARADTRAQAAAGPSANRPRGAIRPRRDRFVHPPPRAYTPDSLPDRVPGSSPSPQGPHPPLAAHSHPHPPTSLFPWNIHTHTRTHTLFLPPQIDNPYGVSLVPFE